jgi:hypothetical protein
VPMRNCTTSSPHAIVSGAISDGQESLIRDIASELFPVMIYEFMGFTGIGVSRRNRRVPLFSCKGTRHRIYWRSG